MFSIKIISLKKDKIKRDLVLSQLEKLNLSQYVQVIDAINGKELSLDALNDITSNRKNFAPTKFNRALSAGEIGCSLSHQAIYESLNVDDVFLILEDDVVISPDLTVLLKTIEKLPTNWEVLLLGHQVARVRGARISVWGRKKLGKFIIGKPVELACGAYGYLINYKGANKLMQALKSMDAPIDHYTGITDFVNLYAIKEPIIHFSKEQAVHSNITSGRSMVEAQAIRQLENDTSSTLKKFVKSSFLYHPIKFLLKVSRRIIDYLKPLMIVRFYRDE